MIYFPFCSPLYIVHKDKSAYFSSSWRYPSVPSDTILVLTRWNADSLVTFTLWSWASTWKNKIHLSLNPHLKNGEKGTVFKASACCGPLCLAKQYSYFFLLCPKLCLHVSIWQRWTEAEFQQHCYTNLRWKYVLEALCTEMEGFIRVGGRQS